MRVSFGFRRLYPGVPLRIRGVVTDTAGDPLSRQVILHDETSKPIAETRSAADGTFSFIVTGANFNNRYVVRAVGHVGECDDISCPMRGEVI